MEDWLYVGAVEAFDVSAVAFAFLGAKLRYKFEKKSDSAWFDVYVRIEKTRHYLVMQSQNLLLRAQGVANRTPLLEVKHMASCCGLGLYLCWSDPEVCPYCGAHQTPKKTGEPPWRIPKKVMEAAIVQPVKKFWVSWYTCTKTMGPFTLYTPWWISGETDEEPARSIVCAAIKARDDSHVRELIHNGYDKSSGSVEFRFIIEKNDDWEPYTDRFQEDLRMRQYWTRDRYIQKA